MFIPVLTEVVTQDERNCDHKTGKTSKWENNFSMIHLGMDHNRLGIQRTHRSSKR